MVTIPSITAIILLIVGLVTVQHLLNWAFRTALKDDDSDAFALLVIIFMILSTGGVIALINDIVINSK